jgi:hypothetical protein
MNTTELRLIRKINCIIRFINEVYKHLCHTCSFLTSVCNIHHALKYNKYLGEAASVVASGTQVRGFKPGRSRRIFGRKNPQHVFLRRGSKAVCPMTQLCRNVKEPYNYRGSRNCRLNLIGYFSPIAPPLANRGLSSRLMWSASGDEGGN